MKSKSLHQDVYISIALYVAFLFFLSISLKLPGESRIFPSIILVALLILNTFVLIKGIKQTMEMRSDYSVVKNSISWEVIKVPLLIFLMVVAYGALFRLTNYFISTSIFMIGLLKFYKVKSWKAIILITIGFNVVVYFGFSQFLKVPLF